MVDELLVAFGIYLLAIAFLGVVLYGFWHKAERIDLTPEVRADLLGEIEGPRMIELREVVKGGDLDRLTAKVQELESRLGEKERTLEGRSTEARELRLRLDVLMNEMAQIQSRLKEVEASATREAQQAKELTESLTIRVRDLENQAKEGHKLFEVRDAELKDLKAKVQVLVSRMTRMESILREVGELVFNDAQEGGQTGLPQPSAESQGEEGEPNRPSFQGAEFVAEQKLSARVSEKTISPQFFDRMIQALIEAMGPIAPLVVRDQIDALGESPGAFPKKRVAELVEIVSHKILDQAMKAQFRQQMAEEIRGSLRTKGTGPEHQIKQKQTVVPPKESSTKELHDNLSAKIHRLESRLLEREALLKMCEKELKYLQSRMVARLQASSRAPSEKAQPRQAGQNSLIQARGEISRVREQMSAEMERLKAELKEKKILLAEIERNEWHSRGLRGFRTKSFGA